MNNPILADPKDLQIIHGDLVQVIGGSEPYSRQMASEISLARTLYNNNPNLATQLADTLVFYVAHASLFTRKGSKLLVGITGRDGFNLVFGQDTKEAFRELEAKDFYTVPQAKADVLLASGDTTFVEYKTLELVIGGVIGGEKYGCIPIRTNNFTKDVTPARTPFVRAGYGEGIALGEVMNYLATNPLHKISETEIGLPNPDFVAEVLKGFEDGEILARACRLGSINNGYSTFDAFTAGIGFELALYGIPVKPAEGGMQRTSGIEKN